MKNKVFLFLSIFLCSLLSARAQSGYSVGISHVSIEPDSTLFSLALSGYGYPIEGRFSIDWIGRGNTPQITAITGLEGKFYAAGDGWLWIGVPAGNAVSWKSIGPSPDIKALAALNGKLYAVNNEGALLIRNAVHRNANWHKASVPGNIKTVAALQGKLYATNDRNELMSMDPGQRHAGWKKISNAADNLQSLTAHGARLYAVSTGDTLWCVQPFKPDVPWMEKGRYNGVTYDIHIKRIAALNNRLYAVSGDDKLFVARHSSDGNLSATAFAVKDKDKTVVLAGVDLTGFNYSLTDAVKEIISKERHIPKQAILINASHTHFSPVSQAFPAWQDFLHHPDSAYFSNILVKGMVKAIEEALDHMSPAGLYFGRGTTDIGHNRVSANQETPADKTLDVLEAKNSEGRVTGILFLTACHAVFNNAGREGFTISANFPGVTRKLIRERTGAPAVFIQGCAGDINPRDLDHQKTGKELADDVMQVLDGEMTKLDGGISFSFDSLHIPIHPWSVDKIKKFREDNSNKKGDVEAAKNVRWADLMLKRYENDRVPQFLPEYIQTISIGDWKLVGLSREAVNEYGPAIRKVWPAAMVSVAGYSNDVSSYLPKEWHVVTQTYEGYGSFLWYGQAGMPPINIFERVMQKVRSLSQ